MPQPAAPRRARRPRSSLTVESILDAAERVAAGGDALTIRAVADEVGASPMALYRYFTTKEELLDALLNRVLGRIEPGRETGDWLHDLGAFARRHRALLMAHPWAIAMLIARPFPGANAVPIGEDALRILARGGIEGELSVAIFSGILALDYGWAAFSVAKVGDGGVDAEARIAESAALAAAFPLTAAVTEPMARYGSESHYESVLTRLLAGIAATPTPTVG